MQRVCYGPRQVLGSTAASIWLMPIGCVAQYLYFVL